MNIDAKPFYPENYVNFDDLFTRFEKENKDILDQVNKKDLVKRLEYREFDRIKGIRVMYKKHFYKNLEPIYEQVRNYESVIQISLSESKFRNLQV